MRLSKLSLDSLELGRLRFDLIMIFNIIHVFVEVDISVPVVNSAMEHRSVRSSGRDECSVVKVSGESGAERVQTAAVNQFGWEDVPYSDSSLEI